jgi:hypothetical protein
MDVIEKVIETAGTGTLPKGGLSFLGIVFGIGKIY